MDPPQLPDTGHVLGRLATPVLGLSLAAACTALFGLAELIQLSRGRFMIGAASALRVLAAYGLFGLVVGLFALTGFAIWLGLRGRFSERRPADHLAAIMIPICSTAALGGIFLNKRMPPGFWTPTSVLGNGAILLAAMLLGWALYRSRRIRRLAALSLALLFAVGSLLLGLSGAPLDDDPGRYEPTHSRLSSGVEPTLIVVVIDTLRADHLGAYGYGHPTSPVLDRIAAQSILFERAYSPANWTRPAVASLMTSTLPSRHGVVDFDLALPSSVPLLAQTLQQGGYRTALFSSNPNVEPEDGYWRGTSAFFRYTHRGILGRTLLVRSFLAEHLPSVAAFLRTLLGDSDSSAYSPTLLTDEALDWLRAGDAPKFAYLHYAGPHAAYVPPAEYLEQLGGRSVDKELSIPPGQWAGREALTESDRQQMILQYDAEILWHDEEIARLFAEISEREDVVLIVTSDHGEAFGENGVWAHGASMFDEVVQVPLLFWCPAICGPPRRLEATVSLIDLAPTLLEMAGVPEPSSYEGSSLLSLLTGSAQDHARSIIVENPLRGETSIRTADWSLAMGPDAREERVWMWRSGGEPVIVNRIEGFPERHRLEEELQRRLANSRRQASEAPRIELDPERLEELKALGYID